MTPLAQEIAADSVLPTRRRRWGDTAARVGLFDDMHCFECSAVRLAAVELAVAMHRDLSVLNDLGLFLPAPNTWLEFKEPLGAAAVAFRSSGEASGLCRVYLLTNLRPGAILEGIADLTPGGLAPVNFRGLFATPHENYIWSLTIYAMLAMINTPRAIGRKTHMPHRGLQRRLVAARGMVGKFPLRAWTELKLEVRPPRDESGAQPADSMLTGARALHFVRAHVRIKRGRIELVRAHYRGDPALGIKQTRYAVVQPRDGRWPAWMPPPSAEAQT